MPFSAERAIVQSEGKCYPFDFKTVLLIDLSSALVSRAPNIKVATCRQPVISTHWMDVDVGSISVFPITMSGVLPDSAVALWCVAAMDIELGPCWLGIIRTVSRFMAA